MERAAKVVNSSTTAKKLLSDDELVRAVWPSAVGKVIAAHTVRLRVVRKTLVAEVVDAVWQKQLFGLSRQILERVQKALSSEAIVSVEFRVAIARRDVQRADGSRSPISLQKDSADDAEQIQDAVLKKIYQLSRKKASA